MRRILRHRGYYPALALVPVLAAGLGLWLLLSAQTPSPGPEPVVSRTDLDLGEVTAEEAGLNNWLRTLPPDVQPGVSREQAEEVAREHTNGASGILDAVFAQAQGSACNDPCNVWLFSKNVDVIYGSDSDVLWEVVAVDADSGEFLFEYGVCAPGGRGC